MPPRAGCSGSSTTVPPTAANLPLTDCSRAGPPCGSSTCPNTPPGSTRSRSTSPSYSERCLHPTTSTISTNSKPGRWNSSTTTSRSPHHSSGSSPPPTSKTYSTASPLTKTPGSHQPPNRCRRIRHRNSDPDHLV